MPTTPTAKPAWMPEPCSWSSCAGNTVTARLCRSQARSVRGFRATIFCRSRRRSCCGCLARGTRPRNSTNGCGRRAAGEYDPVSQATDADPELLQKANLGAGEMYDQLQKRDLAVKKYEAVVATNSGNAEADKARKRMKDAYRE